MSRAALTRPRRREQRFNRESRSCIVKVLTAPEIKEPIVSRLTSGERNALPDHAFGLPDRRQYPVLDTHHARDAKARASEEFNCGVLSAVDKAQIDKNANQIFGA